jgi:lycopene beta-cyclase
VLADGRELGAAVVVDAAGRAQPLLGRPRRAVAAEQTAFGVVVDEATAAPLVPPGEALFMDWRPDHGEAGWPTFLYGVPLGAGAVLLEETSLARRPGLPLPCCAGACTPAWPGTGSRCPTAPPPRRCPSPWTGPGTAPPGALGFGAAAPLVHPASGFSIAPALQLAPGVAAALAGHLPADPGAALAAARSAVWPTSARVVHRCRHIGLEALLRMPPDRVPAFFDVFFALPEQQRWCYLTGRDDLRGTAATMTRLFTSRRLGPAPPAGDPRAAPPAAREPRRGAPAGGSPPARPIGADAGRVRSRRTFPQRRNRALSCDDVVSVQGMTRASLSDTVFERLLAERIVWSAPRSTTRSPTAWWRSCCCSPRRTPPATSRSTSTPPEGPSPRGSRSTTPCSSSPRTWRRWRPAWRRRWGSSC